MKIMGIQLPKGWLRKSKKKHLATDKRTDLKKDYYEKGTTENDKIKKETLKNVKSNKGKVRR